MAHATAPRPGGGGRGGARVQRVYGAAAPAPDELSWRPRQHEAGNHCCHERPRGGRGTAGASQGDERMPARCAEPGPLIDGICAHGRASAPMRRGSSGREWRSGAARTRPRPLPARRAAASAGGPGRRGRYTSITIEGRPPKDCQRRRDGPELFYLGRRGTATGDGAQVPHVRLSEGEGYAGALILSAPRRARAATAIRQYVQRFNRGAGGDPSAAYIHGDGECGRRRWV